MSAAARNRVPLLFVRQRTLTSNRSILLASLPGGQVAFGSIMLATRNPAQNHLLAALSTEEQQRIFPHLRLVPMPLGKVLYEAGDVLRHVYFPTDSIISLL